MREARKPERIRGRKRQERNARLFRSNPLCARCSARGTTRAVEVWDHIIPLHAGGADDETNLQGLCTPCHEEKTREDAETYGVGAL
jgi:5-methylcytosine-specific restriction protein A